MYNKKNMSRLARYLLLNNKANIIKSVYEQYLVLASEKLYAVCFKKVCHPTSKDFNRWRLNPVIFGAVITE